MRSNFTVLELTFIAMSFIPEEENDEENFKAEPKSLFPSLTIYSQFTLFL